MVGTANYDAGLIWRVCINLSLNCVFGGYTTVAIGTALQCASWELNWGESTSTYISVLAAIFAIGAALGGVVAGMIAVIYGRRKALMIADIIGLVSCLIVFVPSTLMIGLGRLTCGFAFGLMLAITPPFLKEMSPAELSGKTGNLVQLQMCVGNLFGFMSALILPISQESVSSGNLWRYVLVFPSLFLMIQLFVLMYIYPYDSPAWLASENRIQEASQVLSSFYKGEGCETVHRTLIQNYTGTVVEGGPVSAALVARRASYRDVLFDWRFRRMLSIGLVLMMIQQWSGINAVMTYSSIIFESITDRYTARIYTLFLGLVNLGAVLAVIPIIDKFGRVPLLWIGQLTLSFILVCLAIVCTISVPNWLVVLMLCVYLAVFIPSLGSGIWIYCGEVLNMKSMGAAVCFNWINCFFVLLSFQIISSPGLFAAFGLYAACCLAGCVYSARLEETKGLTKEEIFQNVIVTQDYTYLKASEFATIIY